MSESNRCRIVGETSIRVERQQVIRSRSARQLARIVVFVVSAVAAACSLAALPAPPKIEPATLRLDWLQRSYHSPFFLGVEKGWYKEAGIELKINEGRGSGNVIQLVGNTYDTFGFASADAVVRGVQNGIPVVSVANIMPKNADAIFVLKKSGLNRPRDLKGRTIATTPGGTSDVLLPAFLKGVGLGINDVTIVPVDAAAKAQLLLQGTVDAMNSPVWSTSLFVSAGGTNAFLYADCGVQVVGYGIVTNADTLKNNPDLVKRFVAVTMRAWTHALKHPEEALAALERNSSENGKSQARERNRLDLLEALRLVGPAVAGKPFGTQDEAAWEAMQKQLLEYRVIKERRPISEYLTNQFIE